MPYRARHSPVGSQARKRPERHVSLLTYLCCSGGTLGFETEIDAGARVPSCDFPFGFAAAALPLTFVSSPFDEIRARSAVLVCSVVVVAA